MRPPPESSFVSYRTSLTTLEVSKMKKDCYDH